MASNDDLGLLQKMKSSLGSAAELKLSLLNIRAQLPDVKIFVFEGEDDRSVYFNWMKALDRSIVYEPYTCKGKAALLKLRAAVDRDLHELASDVYFFIDRDFDDLKGEELGRSTYMTDGYSIENDLVSCEVVDEILKVELNCQGRPDIRAQLAKMFSNAYCTFLQCSADVNFVIFCMRRLGVENDGALPSSLGRLIEISLDGAELRAGACSSMVVTPLRLITDQEATALRAEFQSLDPAMRYRGKFALAFLMRWLELVAKQRRGGYSAMFDGMDMEAKTRVDRVNVFSLAARATPPQSLARFVKLKHLGQCDYTQRSADVGVRSLS